MVEPHAGLAYEKLGDQQYRLHYAHRDAEVTLCEKPMSDLLPTIRTTGASPTDTPGIEVCGRCAAVEVEEAKQRAS